MSSGAIVVLVGLAVRPHQRRAPTRGSLPPPRDVCTDPSDRRRRSVAVALVGGVALITGPVAGACTATVVAVAGRTSRRRGQRRRTRAIDRQLPDAIDLFVLTVRAGFMPRDALRLLAPVVDRHIGEAFDAVLERVRHGERFPDALAELPARLGPAALTFADTLADAERTGLAIGPALGRLADDARHHRRRSAESAARELPVRLSIPLVVCTLPSFVLVAIVPLLLGTISAIDPPT